MSRLHPALVAAYALLKLAAIKAFGPIWQPQSTRPPQMEPSIPGKLTPRPDFSEMFWAEPCPETSGPQAAWCAALQVGRPMDNAQHGRLRGRQTAP